VVWINEVYRQTNFGEREGSAWLERKGKGRPMVHDLSQSVCVDDMSHEERAEVFNQRTHFYSYDLYSMFGVYAALCGCVPIVVPDPGLAKEQWTPEERDRYGIAYGHDDIPWAIATRPQLLERLREVREEEDAMLRRFVARCAEAFA
jgi:hypothetical protein